MNYKRTFLIGSLGTTIFLRNFDYHYNLIDVRENYFNCYLSPKKYNFIFFDYYEYFVDWKINPAPPCYKYWNISLSQVKFISNDKEAKENRNKYLNIGKIF